MALPAPTPVTPVQGYIPAGKRRYVWITTAIANYLTPTSAELSAGSDITAQVSDASGWTGSSNTVDFPNAASRFTPKIAGMITADDSSLTMNMGSTSADQRSVFNDGSDGVTAPSSGYLAIFYEGIVTGGKMKVFPATVTSVQPSAGVGDAATMVVNFAITLPPTGFISIPTA